MYVHLLFCVRLVFTWDSVLLTIPSIVVIILYDCKVNKYISDWLRVVHLFRNTVPTNEIQCNKKEYSLSDWLKIWLSDWLKI
jgi:hypothetical protein